MTVIKFTDKKQSSVIKPGVNNTVSRVFDAVIKYCLKANLPASADRDELIFTTDTHEIFRGNGKDLDLIAFNTVLIYDSFGDFPSTGVEAKVYVDKSSALMFMWSGSGYQSLGGGDGDIIISPSDAKIGDLANLKTTEKTNLVVAINEVFNALTVIDISAVKASIQSLSIDVTDIKDTLTGIDTNAIAVLENTIGDLTTLTTAQKTSIVGAINDLKVSITSLESSGTDLTEVNKIIGVLAQLSTVDNTSVVAAINEVFGSLQATISQVTNIDSQSAVIIDRVSVVENDISVLQTSVNDIDISITEVNNVIGSLASLTTTQKASIVAAINELVDQTNSMQSNIGDLSLLSDSIDEINAAVGSLTGLATTEKASLVLAINELAAKVLDVDSAVSIIQGEFADVKNTVATSVSDIAAIETRTSSVESKVSTVETNVNDLQTSVEDIQTDVSTIETNVSSLETRTSATETALGSIDARLISVESVNLTEEDKKNYIEYKDLVQGFLDSAVPELQFRISQLEQQVGELKAQQPGDGSSGGGTEADRTVLWEHEFVLPVGVAVYELGDDSTWVSSGNTFDLMDDLYGDTQNVFLYSLGNAGNSPLAPELVPLVGIEGTPPTTHGVWESYTGTDVIFQVASLIAWRFRIVKYAA